MCIYCVPAGLMIYMCMMCNRGLYRLIAGAIAIGDYTEAATVVVLFGFADFLESNCTGKARDAIGAVMALKPDTAILAATGAVRVVDSLLLRLHCCC